MTHESKLITPPGVTHKNKNVLVVFFCTVVQIAVSTKTAIRSCCVGLRFYPTTLIEMAVQCFKC